MSLHYLVKYRYLKFTPETLVDIATVVEEVVLKDQICRPTQLNRDVCNSRKQSIPVQFDCTIIIIIIIIIIRNPATYVSKKR